MGYYDFELTDGVKVIEGEYTGFYGVITAIDGDNCTVERTDLNGELHKITVSSKLLALN